MIARIWQASATPDGAERYRTHFTGSVLPELERTVGFLGAQLLERADDARVEIKVITRWESLDAVRNFAGDDIDTAVVEPAAAAALADYDRTVVHYTVAAERSGRETISLTGAPQTMLATLYGRALDSRSPRSILHDDMADRTVRRIDYDFRRTGMTATTAAGVALRARQLDDWTRAFLTDHPQATVLHLACGLDTRVHRLAPPPTVRWIDLDHPEVIALRERLLPTPDGDYRMIGASVTDEGWLESVPADRPTVAVFEGLTMYLHKADGRRLIQGVTNRFGEGQLLFDAYGTLGIRLQKLVPAVRRSGATLHWGVDDPREIETWHDGLVCLDALRSVEMPGLDELPALGRLQMRVLAHLPGFRDVGWVLRYRF